MSASPGRPGWYADPLKPGTHERRWDGDEWTDETREASVPLATSSSTSVVEEVPSTSRRRRERLEGPRPEEPADDEPEPPPVRSSRTTVLLVVAAVVLLAVVMMQVAYLWGPLKDDTTVSSRRPVLLSQAAERSAADTAAKAAVAFTSRSYKTYDDQVDAATTMMTTSFAAEFRQTTDDAKAKFVEAQAEVTAEVAAQGVMTASDKQVEVLIFLNQFTIKKDEKSIFTPFRLKVTLIDTEQGWLVSDVDAA